MHAPVVVWQRDNLRIVAIDAEDDDEKDVPVLLVERSYKDLMGTEAWDMVHLCDDTESSDALIDMCYAVVADNELLPKWVRQFVGERVDRQFGFKGGKGGAA